MAFAVVETPSAWKWWKEIDQSERLMMKRTLSKTHQQTGIVMKQD